MSEHLDDAEIAARIRFARRCPIPRCSNERRPGGGICWDHHDELGRMLDPGYQGERDHGRAGSIPVLFARLDPTPAAAGDAGPRAPGFASQPPCDLTPIVMRDRRSVGYPVVEVWFDPHPRGYGDDPARPHYEDDTPGRSITKAITGLVEALYDDLAPGVSFGRVAELVRRAHDPHGVEPWCRWMHAHLSDITARDDAAEVYADVRELHEQLRPAAGVPHDEPSAYCSGWVRDPATREKIECRAPLYEPPPQPGVERGLARPQPIDPTKPVIRCPRCDRPYTLLMLLRQRVGAERKVS